MRRSLLALAFLGSLAVACTPPVPPSDGGTPGTTPSSWTDTTRLVLSTLRWSVPAARAITDVVVPEPARSQVGRALDAVADASGRLELALDAYEARGGDRCAAYAAVGGIHAALVQLAQVLADNGIALGATLERVADAAASIADALIPVCQRDAGWASAGDATNRELRAIAAAASARGVVLRRVLDNLQPLDTGR